MFRRSTPRDERCAPSAARGCAFCDTALAAVEGADVLVVLTEWNEFRALPAERLRALMRGRAVADLRNIWEPATMRRAGFDYCSVGRP